MTTIDHLPGDFDPIDPFDYIDWPDADDKFVLRVSGDSMIDDHICDGDYVIVQRTAMGIAKDGQVVAIRTPDGEAILRVFRRDAAGGRSWFETRNKGAGGVDEMYADGAGAGGGPAGAEIVGVLVGVVRRY